MLQEGQAAPDFKVRNDTDEEVSLSDFHGQNVVLYFYPKDNTSGWTNEALGFRDLKPEFEKLNAVILGVSPDSVKSHQNFSKKNNLTFILLSDENKEVVQLYDVWKEKSIYGRNTWGSKEPHLSLTKNERFKKYFQK